MTHEELSERIGFLSYEVIEHMPIKDFAAITDDFSEDLIRDILVKFASAVGGQERAWTFIKHNYKEWLSLNPTISTYTRIKMEEDGNPYMLSIYPKYFEQIEFDIKYDIPLKKTPPISPLPPINEIVYNINTKGSDKNQESIELEARVAKLEAELKSRDDKIAEKDTKIASLQQLLEQKEFRSTKPEDATLKEEIERLKQKREDMLVELLRPSFIVEADARRFVKEIDNGMNSHGVAEVARRYYLGKKIIESKRGRSIWEILHAAKLYDKVEQSWTREMRKAD